MKIGVIGLGIAGLSAAACLSEAGHEVHGFEQFDLLHARGSSHGDTRIFRRYPFEGTPYPYMGDRAYHAWRAWNVEAGEDLFVECGGIDAGPSHVARIADAMLMAERHNAKLERLTSAECAQRFGIFKFPVDWLAIYQSYNGYVRPDATRAFLASKATKGGAHLQFGVEAELDAETQTITVKGRSETFDRIIIAAGPWVGKVVPAISTKFSAERRVLAWYKPEVAISNVPVFLLGTEIYGMPTPDGEIKIGMNDHFREKRNPDLLDAVTDEDRVYLDQSCASLLTGVAAQAYKHATCFYTNTADEDFVIDRHPDNADCLILSCCSGHGFKYAPVYGEVALDWIEGRDRTELHDFKLDRLQI